MKLREYDLSSARHLAGGLLLLASLPAVALDIATKPLIIPSPLAPNVVLTVEEAQTMRRGVPPYSDNISDAPMVKNDAKRYHYSAHYNPLYYNPKLTYEPPAGYATSFEAALKNGYNASSGTVNLGESQYRPTYAFDPTTTSNPDTYGKHPKKDVGTDKPFPEENSTVQAYYYTFSPSCNPVSDKEKEDCYSLVWVSASSGPDESDERENFANWYSFYRTRYLATITALHLVMPKLEGKIRLAWQGTSTTDGNFCRVLNGSNCKDRTGETYDNGLKPFVGEHKKNFYQWLSKLGSGGTGTDTIQTSMRKAMKRVGDYLSDKQRYCDDPANPESADNPARSCRDNIHLMISDGENRDSESVVLPADGDVDSTAFALGESDFALAYTPQVPYMDYPLDPKPEDKNAYTLADIAFYYWARDLVSGLENNLLPYIQDKTGTKDQQDWNPRNDPATWQHIVNYSVITGMSYVLGEDWATNTYDGKQAKGEKDWPYIDTAGSAISQDPARIYDYWHAALNSRGQFYGVDEVDRLVQALEAIALRLEQRLAASAAIAANSTRLDTGTVLYQARFTAVDWTGELIASALNADGSVGAELWQASIPAHGERNIVSHDGSAAQTFDNAGLLPSDWASQVGVSGASAAEVLAWLRGDKSLEQAFDANGNLTGGKYRRRASLLGDIVNSDPVYVGNQDYGYASLPEAAGDAYKNFVTANKNRVKMLYVGANDGMLHGFVAGSGTGADNECGATLGRELFAYIPNAARQYLPTLANPTYGQHGGVPHRYYVDGPAYAGDAFIGGSWKTVLLGTTGAGGRSIFALDVTNPCDFGPGKVLWERDYSWDADLGYTLGKPIIARLNNGKWAAVFGNGYNSGSGKAALFLVDLADGTLIKKFVLDNPSGVTDNGLAAPSLYDADGNGTTDYIYAGDLQGRLWKFDVSDSSESTWAVAYSNKPLFTAIGPDGPQPITTAPELGTPPGGVSGVMVYFGTGRFFAKGDEDDKSVHSLYGLLDDGSPIASRTELVAQSITAEETIGGRTVRKTSKNTVSYPTNRGWYLDLDYGGAKGERVISTPRRLFGRVFYTTLVPEADPCKFGGTSWLIELEPGTGAMPETSIIDVGGEAIAGVMSTVGIVKSFDFLSGEKAVAIGLGSTGMTEVIRLKPPSSSPRVGRISWREIID